MVTKEQFDEWKTHPVTIDIFNEVEAVRAALMEGLASGKTFCQTAEETHGNTAVMVGHIAGLNQLLNISYVDDSEDWETAR